MYIRKRIKLDNINVLIICMFPNIQIFENKLTLIKFSSGLYYLLPLAILSGPFFPDLFISIISLIFLYKSYVSKKTKYFKNKFFLIFIIFYFYLLINSLFSDYTLFSLESSFFYFRFGIFSLATWYLIEENEKFLVNLKYIFLATFVFAIFDGYIQYLYGVNFYGFGNDEGTRLSLPFNDKLLLGGYLARLFPVLIALLLLGNRSIYSYIFFAILLIATDVLIYISGERTALGLMFFSTLLIIIFLNTYRILRILTLVISVIIILFITISNDQIRDRNIDLTINQLGLSEQNEKIYLFSHHHESHILSAYKMFRTEPIIGHGVNTFRKYCDEPEYNIDVYSCSTHPHNSSIQILAEIGILGFLPYLFLNISIIFILLKNLYLEIFNKSFYLSNFQILLLISILLSIWPLFPTQNIFNNWINIIYYFPVGFYLYSIYGGKKNVES